MFWALIPMIAGMAAQALGSNTQAQATIEGAETQAEIEGLNREYQKKLFDRELEKLKPRFEAGKERGLPLYEQYLSKSNVNLDNMPLYNFQKKLGEAELEKQGYRGGFAGDLFNKNLRSAEQDAGYSRLTDLLKIALGSSESAGGGAQNYASSLASSFSNASNALQNATQREGQIRQGMYTNLASQIGRIPSAVHENNQLNNMGY